MPWIWVAIPPAAACAARAARMDGCGHPDAPIFGVRRTAVRRLERLEHRRGARAEGPVGEELQPAKAGPAAWIVRQGSATAQATVQGSLKSFGSDRSVDPDRQPTGPGQIGVGNERSLEPRISAQDAGVVDGHDPERDQITADDGQGRLVVRQRGHGNPARDEAGAALSCRIPLGRPSEARRIRPPAGSRGACAQPGVGEGSATDPQGVVVVGPERHGSIMGDLGPGPQPWASRPSARRSSRGP